MKARFLALAFALAWPSFARAGWFNDNIGRPITGGLGEGAHLFKGAMVTGAKQTGDAVGSAAHQAGLGKRQENPAPSPDPTPTAADKRLPTPQPGRATDASGR